MEAFQFIMQVTEFVVRILYDVSRGHESANKQKLVKQKVNKNKTVCEV